MGQGRGENAAGQANEAKERRFDLCGNPSVGQAV